jgi:hypothetical protein
VALAAAGATDVLLTKSDIHVDIAEFGFFVYSVGFGYTLCTVGGPIAFVSSLWLWRLHRRLSSAGLVRNAQLSNA